MSDDLAIKAIQKILGWNVDAVKRRFRNEKEPSLWAIVLFIELERSRPRKSLVRWLCARIPGLVKGGRA